MRVFGLHGLALLALASFLLWRVKSILIMFKRYV